MTHLKHLVKFSLQLSLFICLISCDLEKESNEACEQAFRAYIKALANKDYKTAISYLPKQISKEKISERIREMEEKLESIRIDTFRMIEYGKLLIKGDSLFKRMKCESTTKIESKTFPAEGAIGRLENIYGKGQVKFDSTAMEYSVHQIVNMLFIKKGKDNWVFIEYDPKDPSALTKKIVPKEILKRL